MANPNAVGPGPGVIQLLVLLFPLAPGRVPPMTRAEHRTSANSCANRIGRVTIPFRCSPGNIPHASLRSVHMSRQIDCNAGLYVLELDQDSQYTPSHAGRASMFAPESSGSLEIPEDWEDGRLRYESLYRLQEAWGQGAVAVYYLGDIHRAVNGVNGHETNGTNGTNGINGTNGANGGAAVNEPTVAGPSGTN
jgi:hypothetical protein